jgi:hypothetical protein
LSSEVNGDAQRFGQMGAQDAGQTGDVTRRDVSWGVLRCTRMRDAGAHHASVARGQACVRAAGRLALDVSRYRRTASNGDRRRAFVECSV